MTGDKLRRALEALERGELKDARRQCHEYLQLNVNDTVAWRLLGSVETAARDYAAAQIALERASNLDPWDASNALAAASFAIACGRRKDAIEDFRRAVSLASGQAEILTLAGEGLGNLGHLEEAEQCFRKALDSDPCYHRARFGLALAWLAQGSAVEAIELMRDILRAQPELAPVWLQLGGALITTGGYEQAETALRRHLELSPDNATSLTWLGAARQFQGDFDAAETLYRAALDRAPDSPDARANLGKLLQATGRPNEAAVHFRHALTVAPRHLGAASGLAAWQDNQGLYSEALETLDTSDADPTNPELAPIRARVMRRLDRTADARALLEAALQREDLSEDLRIQLRFSLAAIYDELGDYDLAWHNATEANESRRALYPGNACREDLHSMETAVRQLKATFDASGLRAMAGSGCISERPVFILGMPRAGKSLVEQMICSHPEVCGAGELTAIGEACTALAGDEGAWPRMAATLNTVQLAEQAGKYLALLDRVAGTSAERVSDTMPFNFVHIGLIEMLFPKARIIHCVRHPADLALRCYLKNFAGRSLSFAFSLGDIVRYYVSYRDLMIHWRAISGLSTYDLRYETLVSEPEEEAGRLIRFLGLDWNDSVLRFYEPGVAKSAAQTPVRCPLHRREVGAWRNYANHLEDMLRGLSVAEYERGKL